MHDSTCLNLLLQVMKNPWGLERRDRIRLPLIWSLAHCRQQDEFIGSSFPVRQGQVRTRFYQVESSSINCWHTKLKNKHPEIVSETEPEQNIQHRFTHLGSQIICESQGIESKQVRETKRSEGNGHSRRRQGQGRD